MIFLRTTLRVALSIKIQVGFLAAKIHTNCFQKNDRTSISQYLFNYSLKLKKNSLFYVFVSILILLIN